MNRGAWHGAFNQNDVCRDLLCLRFIGAKSAALKLGEGAGAHCPDFGLGL